MNVATLVLLALVMIASPVAADDDASPSADDPESNEGPRCAVIQISPRFPFVGVYPECL